MDNHLRRTFLVLPMIIMFIIQGCSVAPQHPPEKTKIKILLVSYLSYAPLFIAQEEGFYEEQGLEAEFITYRTSAESIPALVQGDLDVVGGAVSLSFLNAIAQEQSLKIVADKGNESVEACPYSAIIVRKDLAQDIQDISDLKGKIFALDPVNYMGYYTNKILSQAGLTLDDIEINDIPNTTYIDAFDSGAIDFATIAEPWLTRVINSGVAEVWIPAKDVIPDFQTSIILYGTNFMEQRDLGNRFMVAYLQAVRQYQEGKTERNLEIISKNTEIDIDLLKQTCWPDIHADGSINIQSILDFEAWAQTRDLLKKLVTPEQFWDSGFIEYANQKLGGQ